MRVLITRPEPDASALADKLKARGHETLIEPLLRIEAKPDAAVDLAGVQALAFTSANGVRVFAGLSARRDLPVFAVGDSTAAAARAAGFASVESATGDVEALAALIAARLEPGAGAIFHGAARKVAGDLKGALDAAGFQVRRAVLYEAVPSVALTPNSAAALREGRVDAVLFFSPRTGESFIRLLREGSLTEACGRSMAVCLSSAVAETVEGLPWRALRVAVRPDEAALLESLEAPGDTDA